MEENKLAALIGPLETFAANEPGLYKLRVAVLAALGYVYLLLIVSILLGVVAVILFYVRVNWVMLKVLWIPLVVVGIVLRSLWITIPVPDGAELEREQASALFDLIHEVTTALNGPKIHHVLLSSDYNASIVQIPQFGMFGFLVNYLTVGLPLMRALSPGEFRAVLAHEVGHLSGKHGRFSGWIYRLRTSWIQILMRVRYERSYASFLFEPFLNWYAPYLNAYSFVLARAQERQADGYAVELAGREVAAVMLARFQIKERELAEEFWPNFFSRSKEQPQAPRDPFEQMLGGLDQPVGPANAQKWFFEALRVPTGYDDTHPALADRLEALGYPKNSPEVAGLLGAVVRADEQKESAASHFLRELPEDFLARQNRLFREQLVQRWNESHAEINEATKRLNILNEQASEGPLTLEQQWERVNIVARIEDRNATIPSLQTILRDHPDHAGAHFAMGAILLEQHNAEGVDHLEKAIKLSPAVTGDASTLLAGFYFEQGDHDLAETFRKRAADYHEKEQRQREQALNFSERDKFIPHDLAEGMLKEIQAALNKVRGLSEAFLFRKVIEGSNEVYVLGVLAGYTWEGGESDKHLQRLFEDLVSITVLPTPLVFLPLDISHDDLIPKIKAVSGAAIYKRG